MAGSEYYDHTTYPATSSAGSSAAMRSELDTIEAGFGKLIALSGNGNKYMKVNSGATAHAAALISDDGTTITAGGDIQFSNADPNLLGADTNGTFTISPNTGSLGGNIRIYGDTHGTKPSYIEFYEDATLIAAWDTTQWDFQATNITTSGNINGGTLSGSNTGDQTITLTGDVTGTGTGSFATTIAAGAVDYAMIQNVSATDKILGRSTAGAGVVEEIACTAFGRSIIDDANEAAFKATVNLEIGTDVQAFDAVLDDLSALSVVADNEFIVGTGAGTYAHESGATARTSMGVGTGDSPQFTNVYLTTGIEVGHASDTTITRVSAGVIAVEGDTVGMLATVQNWTAAQASEITAVSVSTATYTPNFNDSNDFSFTLSNGTAETLANPTNITAGQSGSIFITQNGTGATTLAYGTYWDFADGAAPSISTTLSAVCRIDYHCRTTTSIHAVLTNDIS